MTTVEFSSYGTIEQARESAMDSFEGYLERELAIHPARAEEYREAEQQARDWVASGFGTEVPDAVVSESIRADSTHRDAAQTIIDAANARRRLIMAARRQRFVLKKTLKSSDIAGCRSALTSAVTRFRQGM